MKTVANLIKGMTVWMNVHLTGGRGLSPVDILHRRLLKPAFTLLTAYCLLLTPLAQRAAWAEISSLLNYQGRLTGSDGKSVQGPLTITFRLYDAATGGTKKWEETQTFILTSDDDGVFNAILGSATSLGTVDFNGSLWLSIQVAGDSEMSPRQRLTAVGAALNAAKLNSLESTSFLRTDVDTATSGKLTITRSGTALVIKPTTDPAASTKLIDVQNAAGTSKFSVDLEGDVAVAGDLSVSGTISGAAAITGTTNTTWTVDSDNTSGSEPASGAGLVVEGGSGDVSLVWDATNDEMDLSSALNAAGQLRASKSASTTSPSVLVSAESSPAFSTSTATQLVLSQASGGSNNFIDAQVGGTSKFKVDASGNVTIAGTTSSTGTSTFTSDVTLNAQADLRFADTDSSNWVALQAPSAITSNVTWTLPSADGSANQVLTTDGSGTLAWATASSISGVGDITSVTAGSGLTGGGTSGDVTLTVATDGITAAMIIADAVGTSEIATDGVSTAEIAADAVGTSEIATDGVGAAEIAAGAVDASELASTAVTAGSYGSATQVPAITVDADGRLTAASNTTISITGSNIQADQLDFTEFKDSMALDANTTIDLGGFDLILDDMSSTDVLQLQNAQASADTATLYVTDTATANAADLVLTTSDGGILIDTLGAADLDETGASPALTNVSDAREALAIASSPTATASDGVLKLGRKGGSWEYIWYNSSADQIVFSATTRVESSSPAYLLFSPPASSGSTPGTRYGIKFNPDVTPKTLSFVEIVNPTTTPVENTLFEMKAGGRMGLEFTNLVRNGSFEAFSALEKFKDVGFGGAFQHGTTAATSFEGGWDNFAPDEWVWIAGDVLQHSPTMLANVSSSLTSDAVHGKSAVGVKDSVVGTAYTTPSDGNDGAIKQTLKNLKASTTYAIGVKALVTNAGNSTALVDVTGEDASGQLTPVGQSSAAALSTTATTYTDLIGTFTTDSSATDVVIYLLCRQTGTPASSDMCRFDAIQVMVGKSVPEFAPNSLVDSGDQTLYGLLRVARTADSEGGGGGGILAVDRFVRTRGVEFFKDDPGFTGKAGGIGTIGPPNPPTSNPGGTSGSLTLTASGTYTGNSPVEYKVRISGTGTPNTFVWSKRNMPDGAFGSESANVNVSTSAQTIDLGVQVAFNATTGGNLNDEWRFNAMGMAMHDAYSSFSPTASYTPGDTRILVDPVSGKLTFQEGTKRVTLDEITADIAQPAIIEPPTFSGTGGLSMSTLGTYTGADSRTYEAIIDTNNASGSASADTFKWRRTSSASFTTLVSIPQDGTAVTLEDGVKVQFFSSPSLKYNEAALSDKWTFNVRPSVAAANKVSTVKVTGQTALTGNVTFSAGSNVTLTQSGQDISIAAVAGGGIGDIDTVGDCGSGACFSAAATNPGILHFEGSTNDGIEVILDAANATTSDKTITLPDATGTVITTGNLTSITTTGTISSGTWQGTAIGVGYGGTGQTSYTDGQLLIGNSTGNTLTKATLTGTSNQITVTNGGGSITLSTPQDIHTAATPQFARLGLGAAADGTKLFTLSSAAPDLQWLDTTASAKDLYLKVDGNKAYLQELAGADGDLLTLDLANNRVGIGTTSPANRFVVEAPSGTGNIVAAKIQANPGDTGDLGADWVTLVIDNLQGSTNFKSTIRFQSNGTSKWEIGNDILSEGAQAFFIWDDVADATRLLIGSTGNVGIGAIATQKLHVYSGAADNYIVSDAPNANSSVLALYSAGALTGGIYRPANTTDVRIYSGADRMTILNSNGNVGIGTTSPSYLLSLGGDAARTMGMERHTTANTAGNVLTLLAGGATSGATDKAGGDLTLSSGTATGTGASSILFQTPKAGSTGTTDNAPATRATLAADNLNFSPHGTSAGNTYELRFLELAANGTNYMGFKAADALAGNVIWTLPAADGTDGQVLKTNGSGVLSWTAAGGSGDVTDVLAGTGIAVTNSGGPQPSVALDYAATLAGDPQLATNITTFASTGVIFEGATGGAGNANEGLLTVTDPTADRTWTLPDATGTVITTGNLTGITTTGTISSGVWQGTAVGVGYGGTGQTSYTDGQLLIGNSTGNTLTKATLTGTANQIAVANGGGSITLSTPQDIHTAATPQFARLGLGAAADGTKLMTLSSGAPDLQLLDTTASAKDLYLKVDGNKAYLQELAGADGTLMVFDLANNRVGIGAYIPGAKLEVQDATAGTGLEIWVSHADTTNGASNAILHATTQSTGGDPQLALTVSGVRDWTIGVDNSDSDKLKIAPAWGVGSGDVVAIDTAGNVGIGMVTPTSTLHVVSTGSLAIPQGTGPTVDGAGEIAVDTTDDQLVYYGGAARVLGYKVQACAYIPDVAATDDNFVFWVAPQAVTVTDVGCRYVGTGTTVATVTLEDASGNVMTHTAPTCVTTTTNATYQSVSAAGGLVAGEGLAFDVTNTPSPASDDYVLCVRYIIDRQ